MTSTQAVMSSRDSGLTATASHIVHRLADAAVEDMRARYDLGRMLLTLREQRRRGGGTGTLLRLAEHMGVDPSALRRYAHVCETIAADEFEALTRLRTGRGGTLTWSHVELLSRAKCAERRRALAAAVAAEELSVRALSDRLRAER